MDSQSRWCVLAPGVETSRKSAEDVLESLLRTLWIRRRATLCGGLILLAIAVFALPDLSLNDSPERWMPAGAVDDWRTFGEHFNYGDSIVIGVHFHRPVKDEDADFLRKVRLKLKKISGVVGVIDPSLVALSDNLEFVPLTELMDPSQTADDKFALYKGVIFDDPNRWRETEQWQKNKSEFDTPNDRSTIIYIECQQIDSSTHEGKQKLDEQRRRMVRETFAALKSHERGDVTFHVIGAIVIQSDLEKIARRVSFTFIPLSVLLTFLALGIGFRSLKAVAIAVAGAAWGVTIMLGGVAWAGWSLNVVTVGGPTLMFVIVIATTVHFAHHESENHETSTISTEDTSHIIRWVAFPCLGAALTTGTGFLMLVFNELTPTRELGAELFAGAILAFFGAFLLWLLLHPFRAAKGRFLSTENLGRFHQKVTKHPAATIMVVFLLMTGMGFSATRVAIDADPFSFFHRKSTMAAAFRHITQRHYGLHRMDVLLISKQPVSTGENGRNELSETDREAAWKFQREISTRPEFRGVISTLSLSEEIEQLKMQTDTVSQIRAEHMEKTFHSWLHDHKNEAATRITFKVDDTGEGFRPLMDAIRKHQPNDRFDCVLTGTAANVVVLSENLLGGITRGLGTALLVMAGLCIVWFRSIRLTLIAFLPNIFPVLAVFGLMGLLDIPLNCGSAMVMTISLGIALNDTVHFIVHYLQHKQEGADTDTAVEATVREIGRPIVMTSLVNCLGFAIFVLSDFKPMFHFGSLISVAMLAALIGDLILLPNLLKLFDQQTSVIGNSSPETSITDSATV